jgi:hypothetical protein
MMPSDITLLGRRDAVRPLLVLLIVLLVVLAVCICKAWLSIMEPSCMLC